MYLDNEVDATFALNSYLEVMTIKFDAHDSVPDAELGPYGKWMRHFRRR